MTTARLSRQPLSSTLGFTLIIVVAIGGLFYVKWLPYSHKAIWQAMVLGLLLAAAVQEFAPRAWLARLLGRSDLCLLAVGLGF
jgi:uncharacterized protein